MSAVQQHVVSFTIDSAHPALAGHFPGRPVVPGVVLLDRIGAAIVAWKQARVVGLPQVKFMRPLLPGEEATLHLESAAQGIRFHISHDGATIASGQVEIATGETA